ncbi:MAG TPA: hypothetical protein ENJ39_03780 [Flammeovirgaceae bacterium]|nr:hypothetical protein [Flammeovirgaceae bacterium]
MKNIRIIVNELSAKDEKGLSRTFYRPNDKVARLFRMLREGLSDADIMQQLQLNENAYTTLRSRLRSKVQNYLISQVDGPKADVLNKLLSIDDTFFTQKPVIALTTLKKLEKELIRYDLANELTVVYKYMKKLHLNSPEYYHYSQLYNRHVAYSLALDKAEDILGKYFKEYGEFHIMGKRDKQVELTVLFEEMKNVTALYNSHRMQVYFAAMQIIHQLYVDDKALDTYDLQPIEDVLDMVAGTFKAYPKDSIYKHLRVLFKWLRFEYYLKYGIYSKARLTLGEIRNQIPDLLLHYESYGFPAQILPGMLQLRLRQQADFTAMDINRMFLDFNYSHLSIPARVTYLLFRALVCYQAGEYATATKWLFYLNNEVSFKEYGILHLEIKCLTAYLKYMQNDELLFRQNYKAAQRLLRLAGDDAPEHLRLFVQLLSILQRKIRHNKVEKIEQILDKLNDITLPGLHPTLLLKPSFAELAVRL